MSKRGQVTIFILLGILIVSIIGIAYFLYGERLGIKTDSNIAFDSAKTAPLKEFVEDCISVQLEDDLNVLIRNSGYFGVSSYFTDYGDNNVNYLIYNDENTGGQNRMNGLAFLENEISKDIATKLKDDCSLDDFDFITSVDENIEVNTTIGENTVFVMVNYPMTLGKGDNVVELEEFTSLVESNFGKLYGVVKDLVDDLTSDNFDFTIFAQDHNDVDVSVDKLKINEHIYTVSVKDGDAIQFAVLLEGS